MGKIYTALGLMSGTSMDGVDLSIIRSNGIGQFTNILDRYFEFDEKLYKRLVDLRKIVLSKASLIDLKVELSELEREITIFHGEIVKKVLLDFNDNIDLVGFHGQTIFHDSNSKITKQLGDGRLLSQLIKKTVVYDFRQKDLENNGQGAPLTPIFHNLLSNNIFNKFKDKISNILNIGGISNVTITARECELSKKSLEAFDIGPGNCLIDEWIRKNSDKKFDNDGLIGRSGKINQLVLNQAIENFGTISYNKSFDIKDFDVSFARGLSLEDGCATITNFTAYLIAQGIKFSLNKNKDASTNFLICGGGRKNNFLIDSVKEYLKDLNQISLELIDSYNYDGDYIESQAFGYLAIRSYLGLPITFPTTTGCKKPTTGGVIVSNY